MPPSPVSEAGKRDATDADAGDDLAQKKKTRRSKTEKGSKGLRHFSMKVCQKVQEKNVTTYNEVADELVTDITSNGDTADFDQKNIRRRVYDALNVLMAMDIISKYKKEIRWIGLPTNSRQKAESLADEREKLKERIAKKHAHLQELVLQQIAVQNLVKRNEAIHEPTTQSRIQLPFIIVNTDKDTVIECEMAEDRTKYFFNFNMPFEIHDDLEILKRMGLTAGLEKQECTPEQLEDVKKLLPPTLIPYLEEMARGDVELPQDAHHSLSQPVPQASSHPGAPQSTQVPEQPHTPVKKEAASPHAPVAPAQAAVPAPPTPTAVPVAQAKA